MERVVSQAFSVLEPENAIVMQATTIYWSGGSSKTLKVELEGSNDLEAWVQLASLFPAGVGFAASSASDIVTRFCRFSVTATVDAGESATAILMVIGKPSAS
jgi:hypothetical protein